MTYPMSEFENEYDDDSVMRAEYKTVKIKFFNLI